LKRKISPRTRAIVVQHTFGTPAQIEKIVAVARKHKILVIEDCAHSLGATHNTAPIGTFGDAAFFSFGRDKVLSSVWGGIATIKDDAHLHGAVEKMQALYERLTYPSHIWIMQQLLHPILFALILPMYTWGLGKALLVLFQKFHLLSVPVEIMEQYGKQIDLHPTKYPNALAQLLLVQLSKLDRFTTHRRNIASIYVAALKEKKIPVPYIAGSSYLRFALLYDKRDAMMKFAKTQGVLLGNWYHHTIDPKRTDMASVGYRWGSCPNAEYAAAHVLNLPTRVSVDAAKHILALF
jgi:dTDP-4-amino-4,6-dideoxygalactose transaminase